MKRSISRFRDEEGAVLVLALGFVALMGLITASLVNYSTTGMRSTTNVQTIRDREYAADGVVETAINKVRGNTSVANTSSCVSTTVNSLSMRVDCSDTVGGATEVTFTACRQTGVACTVDTAMLVAKAKYNRSVSPAAVFITSWSARR